MKINKFMAAALCAVTLLTGCGTTPGETNTQSSSSETSTYSEECSSYESQTSSTTTSSTRSYSTTNQTTSSMQVSSTSSSRVNEVIKAKLKPWIIEIYGGDDSNGKNMVEYYYRMEENKYNYNKVRLYVSPNQNTVGELVGEFDHKSAPFMAIFAELTPGRNYYRIQFIGSNVESQISDPYVFTKAGGGSGSSSVARYTHTFTAPSYLTVIPDYSEALALIEQGKEPKSFSVSVQFICPGCGTKHTYNVWLVEFPYSSDGTMPFTAKCGTTSCPYRSKRFSTTIESHAIRIS